MEKITREATDRALQKQSRQFNDLLDEYTAKNAKDEQVAEMDADSMMALTAKKLSSMAADQFEGRLWRRQEAVRLTRMWLQILEASQPELDAAADAAQRAFADLKATTAEHLEAVGLGVESQPAAQVNYMIAAERQFNVHVMQSEPVQLADTAARQAVHHAAANRKQTAAAKSAVIDATDQLKNFYHNTVKG